MTFRSDPKDPYAVLDYVFDWRALANGTGTKDWLESGETITAHSIVAETGIIVDSSSLTDSSTSVTVWLSGGTDGNKYDVSCRITTSSGRKDERTVEIPVANR